MMKNTYLIGYFPFIAIVLFSLSFAVYVEMQLLRVLKNIGIYSGMLEFFSEAGIRISLLIVLVLIFFMIFAALKLISDTIIEVSLLFFSKDSEGIDLRNIRAAAVIYVLGGLASIMSIQSIIGLLAIFLGTSFIAFLYFVYKVSTSLSIMGLIGIIFFHILIWSTMLFVVTYAGLKLYNGMIGSLPIS